MIIDKALKDRLICAKYLFNKGIKVLNQGGPFSACFALLNFQDSAEMVLRVIAEQIGCNNVKETENFDSLFDKINNFGKEKLSNRIGLIQMNKARVGFKHHGNKPNEEDVKKFSRDLDEFFKEAFQSFLDIKFESISLADLIEHKRTENYIKKAEQFLANKDYENVIKQTAIAFAVFYEHQNKFVEGFSNFKKDNSLNFNDHHEDHRNIECWGEKIEKIIIEQQSQLNVIINGINFADYRKFLKYTPYVDLFNIAATEIEELRYDFKNSNETIKDIALFCYNFIIGAIFLMKEHKFLSSFPVRYLNNVKFEVIKKCTVFNGPFEDREIIRQANVGEILDSFYETNSEAIFYLDDKNAFIGINQDSDMAYVKKDSVRIINDENKSNKS